MSQILYLLNDNRLVARGLHTYDDSGHKIWLTEDATVGVILTDADAIEIEGETWPLALVYIVGSRGDFQGVLRNELELTENATVLAQLTIDNGADQYGDLTGTLYVQRRTF